MVGSTWSSPIQQFPKKDREVPWKEISMDVCRSAFLLTEWLLNILYRYKFSEGHLSLCGGKHFSFRRRPFPLVRLCLRRWSEGSSCEYNDFWMSSTDKFSERNFVSLWERKIIILKEVFVYVEEVFVYERFYFNKSTLIFSRRFMKVFEMPSMDMYRKVFGQKEGF